MGETLKQLSWALTKWRTQVLNLALNAMRKSAHGSLLGWVWVFVKPALYIFCFWFALNLGLRAARASSMDGGTYMMWLASGLIPWFFMQARNFCFKSNLCNTLRNFCTDIVIVSSSSLNYSSKTNNCIKLA